jgi:hypothetical protein
MEQETNKPEPSFLALKKTDYEWIKTQDAFSLKWAPAWFDFIERLLILGALRYLEERGNNWIVTIIYLLSYAAFYFYLQALLYNFPFDRFLPQGWIKNGRVAYLFSVAVAAIVLFLIYLTLNSVVAAIAVK